MDFSLSEEQTLLKDSIDRYLTNDYDFSERCNIADGDADVSTRHWSSFAELGWLSVPFAETLGGYGGKLEDAALVFEALGRGLCLEPYLASVMLAGQLLANDQRAKEVEKIIDGSLHGALAALERHSRQDFYNIATTAAAVGDNFVLNGQKSLVLNGAVADVLIVTARTSGLQNEREGASLFMVDSSSTGITRSVVPMMDGSKPAMIEFDDVTVSADNLLGSLNRAADLLDPVLLQTRVVIGAEMLGIMETLCNKTVEYSKTRTQFDVTIGSFQALQHRMVDMLMAVEQSRSMVYRAICECQQDDPQAAATVAGMKALVGRHARYIGEEAIQLHGGMGMTDELDIGHYVKRLMMLNHLFGDADSCLREFCQQRYAA